MNGRPAPAVRPWPRAHVAAAAIAVGVTYLALGKLVVLVDSFGTPSGATFWPGAGLTLGALLCRPRSEWPWYLGAVAIGEALLNLSGGVALALALCWALANTAEPLLAAWLLTRRGRRPSLDDRRSLPCLVLAGLVAGPLLGALIGTAAAVVLAGDPWWPRLPRWYVGDAIGVLVVAPAVLAFRAPPYRRPDPTAAVAFAALVVVALISLGPWGFTEDVGLLFLTLPLLIGIALRYGTRGAAAGVLVVATIVEAVTAAEHGPFAAAGAFAGLVIAQMFVAMTAVTAQTVAVLASELVTRERRETALRAQALRDSLTGLANRRLLFDRLRVASSRLARRPGRLALLFIDLDRFKAINDTFGHATGDAVLVSSAERLRTIVRDHDSVARLGGDEFLILAEDLDDDDDAVGLAARVVAAFEAPIVTSAGTMATTVSVGVATASGPVEDPETLLSSADQAMYAAKRAGGGRVAIAAGRPGVRAARAHRPAEASSAMPPARRSQWPRRRARPWRRPVR